MSDMKHNVTLAALRRETRSAADPAKAKLLAGFFKTGKGEYGEGDVFLGLMVPASRRIVARYAALPFADVARLLGSKYHEERLIALLLLVRRFERGGEAEKKRVFDFYLAHAERANNWDLVDLSAHKIV
ncbi:MAG TPA: DNA alkylation repair protein, partial [Patescibacteria group bacterium]|nr:DNA alkylation repair protein [Patescibacteria group bacterium]